MQDAQDEQDNDTGVVVEGPESATSPPFGEVSDAGPVVLPFFVPGERRGVRQWSQFVKEQS